MSRLHYLISFVAILLLAAYGNWLLNTFKPDVFTRDQAARHDPDYYLEGVSATVIDAAGKPRYQLQAQRVEHFPDNNEISLEAPQLEMIREDDSRWFIRSETGTILENGDRILLHGEVILTQRGREPASQIKMVTRDLTVLPPEDFAETAQRVIITQSRNQLSGTGMRAYLAEDRLELLADGKGTYIGQP